MKYGPKIMSFIKELWNNTISPYKNWHKQIKWFSIFIKPNKCQKKIENRNKRRRGLPGASPVQPSRSRPAQPAGGPAHGPPLLCRLPPRQGNGVCPTLAGTRARHLPPC